ncbi:MAG: response regulator transcription factor [Flavobacteriales bacterium]|nr:response regulator transcription factor [Flavobacteriales bacterium]
MIRIALAEDNAFLAKAIINKLGLFDDIKIKSKATEGGELLAQLANDSNIDIILMDIHMPGMDGIEACGEIAQLYPHIKTIMLTVKDDEQSVYGALKAGAKGYLLKESDPGELRNAIDLVMSGKAMLSPEVASKAIRIIQDPEIVDKEAQDFGLSPRELDVLTHLCN